MTPSLGPSRCVELRPAQESDLPAVLELLGRRPPAAAEHYFSRFGFPA